MELNTFKHQFNIEASNNLNDTHKKILQCTTLKELISVLKEIPYPDNVKIVANSPAFHALILSQPDAFIALFSRDSIKAIIYSACVNKNFALVKCLIQLINLDVKKEKLGSANGTCTVDDDFFSATTHLLHAAIATGSQALVDYSLSLYQNDKNELDLESIVVKPAIACAAAYNQLHLVNYFLTLNFDVHSPYKKESFDRTAMEYAVLQGNKDMVVALKEHGAQLGRYDKARIISGGHLDILKYLVDQGESFQHASHGDDSYFMKALGSSSVEMIEYVLNTLKIMPYPENISENRKEYYNQQILKQVMRTGDTKTFQFIETVLHVPVEAMIKEELTETETYHHMFGNFFMLEAVCSYKVDFLKYLFEIRGLTPNKRQLQQLEGYAYDNGTCLPQHQKFVTHAYVYSKIHDAPYMAKLLLQVAGTIDLITISTPDLFRLFADYSKNFQEEPKKRRYNMYFRENSQYLAAEIAKRHVAINELISLASSDVKLANELYFYFIVLGQGYRQEEVNTIMQSGVFDPNADIFEGNRALHLAIHFNQKALIPLLLAAGADPDAMNNQQASAINLLDGSQSDCISTMVQFSTSLTNTLNKAITDGDTKLIQTLLKLNNGIPKIDDVFAWLQKGKETPLPVYEVMCCLNDAIFTQLKQDIERSQDKQMRELLAFVDHFKSTGKPHEIIEQYKTLLRLNRSINDLRGDRRCGCFGTGMHGFFAEYAILHLHYPGFLKGQNVDKKTLTPEIVADALSLLNAGPLGIEVAKTTFQIWAQKKKLSFGMEEVQKILDSEVKPNVSLNISGSH